MRTGITRAAFFLAAWVLWAPMACAQELGSPPRSAGPIVFHPELSRPQTTTSLAVDTHNRFEVQAFFNWVYEASSGVPMEWSGSLSECSPGTTSPAYQEATIRRINYYRAMAGLPGDVTLDPDWNAKCQAAALMMSAQGQLSHYPDPSWPCYSEAGEDAAGHSNLAGGTAGPEAIDGYITDPGDHNYFVGHRRWILYPPQKVMGTGSVPSTWFNNTLHWAANALWVIGGFGQRPAAPEWVAWPPQGYVPYQVVYARWSFSFPEADFSQARVTMSRSGTPVSLTVLALDKNDIGYADNTIVWEPSGLPTQPPPADITYTVAISDALVAGGPRTFTYDVIIMDPDKPPPSIRITAVKSSTGNIISVTFMDSGTDMSAYSLETTTQLSRITNWFTDPAAVITNLGDGLLRADTTSSPAATTRFYRIKGIQ